MWISIAGEFAKFHDKKDLIEVKIFQKVLGEATFLKHPVRSLVVSWNLTTRLLGVYSIACLIVYNHLTRLLFRVDCV